MHFPEISQRWIVKRMKIDSQGLPLQPAEERVIDFDEAVIRLDEDWTKHEASTVIWAGKDIQNLKLSVP